jgi:hypothetical protein
MPGELKAYECVHDFAALGAFGAWENIDPTTPVADTGCINGPVQGTTSRDRIGRKFVMTKLHMKIAIRRPEAYGNNLVAPDVALNDTILLRLVLVRDMYAGGNAPQMTDVLEEQPTGGAVLPGYGLSFRRLDNTERYKILMDKIITIKPNYQSSAWFDSALATPAARHAITVAEEHKMVKVNFKWKEGHEVTCNGVGGGVGAIQTNAISLHAIAYGAGGNTPQANLLPEIGFNSRIRFKDL